MLVGNATTDGEGLEDFKINSKQIRWFQQVLLLRLIHRVTSSTSNDSWNLKSY